MEAIAPLERKFGKPVTSSNQAVIWELLQMVNSQATHEAAGSLLRARKQASA